MHKHECAFHTNGHQQLNSLKNANELWLCLLYGQNKIIELD